MAPCDGAPSGVGLGGPYGPLDVWHHVYLGETSKYVCFQIGNGGSIIP